MFCVIIVSDVLVLIAYVLLNTIVSLRMECAGSSDAISVVR